MASSSRASTVPSKEMPDDAADAPGGSSGTYQVMREMRETSDFTSLVGPARLQKPQPASPRSRLRKRGTSRRRIARLHEIYEQSDVILIVGAEKARFEIHGEVLALKSPYFDKTILPDKIEFEAPRAEPETMKAVLQFPYSSAFDWRHVMLPGTAKLVMAGIILDIPDLENAANDHFCKLIEETGFSVYPDYDDAKYSRLYNPIFKRRYEQVRGEDPRKIYDKAYQKYYEDLSELVEAVKIH